jgi:hypothetical protein
MRQRIVINVDGPPTEATQRSRVSGRKRRRWPRVLATLLLFVLVVVVVVAAGGFLLWRYYQSSPSYSLTCAIDAARRNDQVEFQKYFNDDEIAKNVLAVVSQKAAARYGYALNSSIQQQIDNTLPTLLPRVKQTVHNEVFGEIQKFGLAPEQPTFIYLLVTVPRLLTVSTEGDTSKVKVSRLGRTFDLTMQRAADRWQVTDFKDDALVQHVVDGVMNDLPAIGGVDPNSPLLKQATKRNKKRR